MNIFTKAIKLTFIVLLMAFSTITVQAQTGNALDFDGINDYVDIPYNYSISGYTRSIQFWVKINSNTGQRQTVFAVGGKTTSYTGYEIYADPDGHWYIEVGKSTPSFIPIQGPAINYGTWTNLAVTYDGSDIRFYENGILTNTFAISGINSGPNYPTRIGAGNTAGIANEFFGGQLDELSVWNNTLTQSQITSNMNNSLTGTEPFLLQYFNFNEGIGNGDNTTPPVDTLNDLAKYNTDGTLHNFALNGNTSNWVSVSALPVNLVNFTGTNKDGANLLQWSTASEQNSSRFEVQRSENGSDFTTVGTVAAAGNSDKLINYQYEDRPLSNAAKYYYRLKMVDKDGATKYSSVVLIKNSAATLSLVYPNPASDHITISINGTTLLNTRALLTDVNGKVLQTISLTQSSTPVNISQYQRGMYVVKFSDGSSVKVVKE
ncbi:MAG: LamG-like jellyroll fold domain-containing protein [Ginsengibacter sp.]